MRTSRENHPLQLMASFINNTDFENIENLDEFAGLLNNICVPNLTGGKVINPALLTKFKPDQTRFIESFTLYLTHPQAKISLQPYQIDPDTILKQVLKYANLHHKYAKLDSKAAKKEMKHRSNKENLSAEANKIQQPIKRK